MTKSKRTDYKKIKRLFNWSLLLLTTASVLALGGVLYASNIIRFSHDYDPAALYSVVEDNPEVRQYLETEHQNEAHFLKISSLVQQNQQRELGRIIVLATIPVIAASGLFGYILSKRLLNPVEEAQASQDRFIQDAAHELRNPLATLTALIQNAKNETAITKKHAQFIKSSERQVKRLVSINEDLLFLERDYIEGKVEKINISELLQDIIEDLQVQARAKKLTFRTKIAPNQHLIINTKDFVKLSKNIIENAIKYSKPTSKTVSIELQQVKGGKLRLSVKDTGIGIKSGELENVTERFYRASNAAKYDGTGLGLSIVKKVANRYDAQLNIQSKSGKGTTVQVDFK